MDNYNSSLQRYKTGRDDFGTFPVSAELFKASVNPDVYVRGTPANYGNYATGDRLPRHPEMLRGGCSRLHNLFKKLLSLSFCKDN
ncbi:unnamed protein product [Gongylonema pulchrum]|uniref:TonB-dependent receptor n=1 Tax=Gongylonema pulchrum TaxID=637853 RepID=A0A183D589_9BILA|nr:unnamed protein product [Gongylonema pulchrum]